MVGNLSRWLRIIDSLLIFFSVCLRSLSVSLFFPYTHIHFLPFNMLFLRESAFIVLSSCAIVVQKLMVCLLLFFRADCFFSPWLPSSLSLSFVLFSFYFLLSFPAIRRNIFFFLRAWYLEQLCIYLLLRFQKKKMYICLLNVRFNARQRERVWKNERTEKRRRRKKDSKKCIHVFEFAILLYALNCNPHRKEMKQEKDTN